MSLTATIASPIALLPIVQSENPFLKLKKNVWSSPVGLKPLCVQFQPFERRTNVTRTSRVKHSSMICAAALNVARAAVQTQPVTRRSSTITVAPIQVPGREKSRELDDGGSGFPPWVDVDGGSGRGDSVGGGGGGGGGGGVGGHWSGGFFLFMFLVFLLFLKDEESEGPYSDERRKKKRRDLHALYS